MEKSHRARLQQESQSRVSCRIPVRKISVGMVTVSGDVVVYVAVVAPSSAPAPVSEKKKMQRAAVDGFGIGTQVLAVLAAVVGVSLASLFGMQPS